MHECIVHDYLRYNIIIPIILIYNVCATASRLANIQCDIIIHDKSIAKNVLLIESIRPDRLFGDHHLLLNNVLHRFTGTLMVVSVDNSLRE